MKFSQGVTSEALSFDRCVPSRKEWFHQSKASTYFHINKHAQVCNDCCWKFLNQFAACETQKMLVRIAWCKCDSRSSLVLCQVLERKSLRNISTGSLKIVAKLSKHFRKKNLAGFEMWESQTMKQCNRGTNGNVKTYIKKQTINVNSWKNQKKKES